MKLPMLTNLNTKVYVYVSSYYNIISIPVATKCTFLLIVLHLKQSLPSFLKCSCCCIIFHPTLHLWDLSLWLHAVELFDLHSYSFFHCIKIYVLSILLLNNIWYILSLGLLQLIELKFLVHVSEWLYTHLSSQDASKSEIDV